MARTKRTKTPGKKTPHASEADRKRLADALHFAQIAQSLPSVSTHPTVGAMQEHATKQLDAVIADYAKAAGIKVKRTPMAAPLDGNPPN